MSETQATEDYANPHHFDVFSAQCPSRKLLNDVTRRWSILVLVALLDGNMYFRQFSNHIGGISDRMLSMTLRALVDDGLVLHDEKSGEYSLTAPGKKVASESRRLLDSLYVALDGLVAARQA